jgi:hypothetical protein
MDGMRGGRTRAGSSAHVVIPQSVQNDIAARGYKFRSVIALPACLLRPTRTHWGSNGFRLYRSVTPVTRLLRATQKDFHSRDSWGMSKKITIEGNITLKWTRLAWQDYIALCQGSS